jgi:predicted chitinase
MLNLFARLFPDPRAISPGPVAAETPSIPRASAPAPVVTDGLEPLKNWSHPFKDSRLPLEQLTHLAKASGGFYPLGVNGLWHGGVHFDAGTAGTLNQSSVHCLADGEVVAYRIDTQSPITRYFINQMTVEKPFSRNFVLVRHRLQAPAYAQSISQLIIHTESEWLHSVGKWDALDELLGHSGSTPHKNWLAEKERMREASWWAEVAEGVGLPADGRVHHLHPVGLVAAFTSNHPNSLICKKCNTTITLTKAFLNEICSTAVQPELIDAMVDASKQKFKKYGVNSCQQIKHLLAQAKKETGGFIDLRESLNYSRKTYTARKLYNLAPTAINTGLTRRGISFTDLEEKLTWIDQNLIGNDLAYGEHCFGSDEQPGRDYRGRGLIHLTHYETYKLCAKDTGLKIDHNPDLVHTDLAIAIETALWFWQTKAIGAIAEDPFMLGDSGVIAVTRPINAGLAGLSDRQKYMREISKTFNHHYKNGCTRND